MALTTATNSGSVTKITLGPESSNDLADAAEDTPKMPSLFNFPEEMIYDRYAACLAATEGLRRARDNEMFSKERKMRLFFKKKNSIASDEEKRAEAKYIMNSSKVIKALGLTVSEFDKLGKEVMQDNELKDRVSNRDCHWIVFSRPKHF